MVPAAMRLLLQLLACASLPSDPIREPVRIWAHSGVERLYFSDHSSLIFKYADAPFDHEHKVLALMHQHGIPVPRVHAAQTMPGGLAMLMDDLGNSISQADDDSGARAAAKLHAVNVGNDNAGLTVLDGARLAALPTRTADMLARLGYLEAADIARLVAVAASSRIVGVDMAPFGVCHSEYHPSSLHISSQGWHLLDFARAFIGPGLLDLASWYGTVAQPDIDRLSGLIERYVALGGTETALANRGGLDAASWALGWHRIWIAHWFTEQITMGWAQGAEETWITTITRHLTEAATLLRI